ncbi:MAG: carbohydrate binding family 9 domain-containing protein [Acidobacteria bacterium]|nr:carbohydrate binding family 9 domain-containing protein [Acidobacteriota bacterium]
MRKAQRRTTPRAFRSTAPALAGAFLLSAATAAWAHQGPTLHTSRASGAISVDGRLDEEAWAAAPVADVFLQRDPDEGAPATERTELRLLYDDHALFVGARLYDHEADQIVRQLSRRDEIAETDTFSLYLDPHHDHRSGVVFEVSAAGVQRDAALDDDILEDPTWDAVWSSAVTVDEGGWTVEMRIPFSQLRFPTTPGHSWGINARRMIHRKAEEAWLALVPKNETGLASRMAHLEGIENITPGKHLELLPYVSGRAEYIAPDDPADPFNDGSRYFGSAGLDLKYGVGTNMVLTGAINPDFGQVEVDPAVVNLSEYETFFEEKRPFFTEGSQTFSNFGRSGASEYWTFYFPEPILFYSRRIGREPQGTGNASFVDKPAFTTILGAAKLTGRTSGGWTLGVLDAVTGSEFAELSKDSVRDRTLVEPLTNYFVGRAQRNLGSRGAIGFIGTAVNRRLDAQSGLDRHLVSQAYVGGVDGHYFLDARHDWVWTGGFSAGTVQGTRESVFRLQQAEQRYYQRPDADYVTLDPSRTSLSGWSGRTNIHKNTGNVIFDAGIWGVSPGLEVNDLGFETQTDRLGGHGMVTFRKLTPDRWTRSRQFWISKWWTYNFGGDSNGNGISARATALLRNYWQLDLDVLGSWDTWNDKLTRGGPMTIRPGIRSWTLTVGSDTKRQLWMGAQGQLREVNFGSWTRRVGVSLHVRPWPALTLAIEPSYRRQHNISQYLRRVEDPTATGTFGARYVFGTLDQDEVAIPLRLNLVFSPKLSLQLYSQVLLSTGAYPEISQLGTPRTFEFPVYGRDLGTIERGPEGDYVIDPDGDGPAERFTLANPDFNFKSLRVNAVLRWEFRLGSTLYVAWTQRRQNEANPGDFSFGGDTADLFRTPSDDVFVVKLAWWFGR